jgi:hypothetical protein
MPSSLDLDLDLDLAAAAVFEKLTAVAAADSSS